MPSVAIRRHHKALALAALLAASTFLSPQRAPATTITWIGNTDATFNTAANWSPTKPAASGDFLIFNGAGSAGAVLSANYSLVAQSITFNGPTGFTINNGSFNL